MLGRRRFDERARGIRPAQFERDGDDLEAERMEFVTECLPTWQIESTASIGRPCDQHHFLAAQ